MDNKKRNPPSPRRQAAKRVTPEQGNEDLNEDLEENPIHQKKKRRIDLTVLKRKRLPNRSLIALRDQIIIAIAVPTKKHKYAVYTIEDSGNAVEEGITTEHEFMSKHNRVSRTTKTTTLAEDGTVDPARIIDTEIAKDSKTSEDVETPESSSGAVEEKTGEKEEKVETGEPKEGEGGKEKEEEEVETGEPKEGEGGKEKEEEDPSKEVKEIGLNVQNAKDTTFKDASRKDQESKIATEASEQVIQDTLQDIITAVVHKETPSDPVVNPPSSGTAVLDEIGIITEYMSALQQMRQDAKDPEIKQKFYDQSLDLAKSLKLLKDSDMPPRLEKVEVEDAKLEVIEETNIMKQTAETLREVKQSDDSPDARLSMGKSVGVKTKDHETSAVTDMDVDDTLDPEAVAPTKKAVVDKRDRKDLPTPMDVDTHNTTVNRAVEVTLGTDANEDRLDAPSAHSSSIATSANAMNIAHTPMEVDSNPEVDALIQHKKDMTAEIKDNAKGMQNKMKVREAGTVPEERIAQEVKKGIAEREKQKSHTIELLQTGGDIEGFETLMQRLVGQDIVQDPKSISDRRRVLAILRRDNKLMDVRTAAAPTEKEIFQEAIRSQSHVLGVRGLGTSGVGTPIFVPGQARHDLYELQKGVATITETEAKQFREEMTPLWNEFKLGRLNAGVREMERMPTRLLQSDQSSLKMASKVRSDMDQQEETFGNFMFWLLHDRLDTSKLATWRAFLMYAAAMGYNNLSQTQINWIITGKENGDLTANTIFSNVNDEEGDPLDQPLEIRGQPLTQSMIRILDAQVIGNPEPTAQYPSRNTSPSAAPVDNSIHPDGSSGPDRANRSELKGIPSFVSNIPDPRFSKRGGKDVKNVRIATGKNPKYDPVAQKGLKEGDKGYEPPYITEEVPDIGAGSKDIQAHIEMAEADRLLRSMPTKLYAPIHSQACDRYLGATNYQRLSLPIEKYMKSYSKHTWGPSDFQQMYNWNAFTMGLYGQMLYAFVTDINMQRTTPVFNMDTVEAVGDEYMELNELIGELAKFQQNADDRADRVSDSGAGQRPLEDHLNKFFEDQHSLDKEKIFSGDAVIISTGGLTPFPPSPGPGPGPTPGPTPGNPWGPGPDPRIRPNEPWNSHSNDRRTDPTKPFGPDNDHLHPTPGHIDPDPVPPPKNMFDASATSGLSRAKLTIGANEMNNGISRASINAQPVQENAKAKRDRMFQMFQGR